MAPAAVPEAAESALAVEVMANALVASPVPSIFAMQLVFEVVLAVQLPVSTDDNPTTPIPALQNPQAVEMTANALGFAKIPTEWSVEVVSLVHLPV